MKKILIGCGLVIVCIFGLVATGTIDARTYFSKSYLSESETRNLADIKEGLNNLHTIARRDTPYTLLVLGRNIRHLSKRKPDAPAVIHEQARFYILDGYSSCGVHRDCRIKMGLEKAEAILRVSLESSPDYATNHVLLGHVYVQKKNYDKAKLELQIAYDLDSADPWLDYNWARMLNATKQSDEALKLYNKVVASDANQNNHKLLLAALENMEGIYKHQRENLSVSPNAEIVDELETVYKKMLTIDAERSSYHKEYAEFLLCWRDDYKTSLKHAQKALKLRNHSWTRRIYGASLYRKWAEDISHGRPDAGQKAYDRAWAVYPYPEDVPMSNDCYYGYKTYDLIRITQSGLDPTKYEYYLEVQKKYAESLQ